LRLIAQFGPSCCFDGRGCVLGTQDHAVVAACVDSCLRAEADGGVDGLRAGMKQVQRPDVDRAAREIDTRRR
jgi:hypothetical protein